VKTLLKQAGADVANLTQVNAFVPDASHRDVVQAAFAKRFPKAASAPAFNVLEVDLPPGAVVRLEIIASL